MAAKKSKLPKAKGVVRIDDPGGHGVGWYARVTYEGKTTSKYFADGSHGGTKKAFELAIGWRDATEKKLGKPRTDRTLTRKSTRNPTGIKGVYRSRTSYVVAWSPEPGQLVREFVSVSKLGEAEALRQAVELRRKRERLVYGKAVSKGADLTSKAKTAAAKRTKKKK